MRQFWEQIHVLCRVITPLWHSGTFSRSYSLGHVPLSLRGCSLSLHCPPWNLSISSWYTSETGMDMDQRCSLVVIPGDDEFPDSGLAGKQCCLITLPKVLHPSSCPLDTRVVVIVGTSLRSLYVMASLELLWVLLLRVLWLSMLCLGELPLADRSHFLRSPWRGYVTAPHRTAMTDQHCNAKASRWGNCVLSFTFHRAIQ